MCHLLQPGVPQVRDPKSKMFKMSMWSYSVALINNIHGLKLKLLLNNIYMN